MLLQPLPFLVFFYAERCSSSAAMKSVLRDVQTYLGDRVPCVSIDIHSSLAKLQPCKVTVAPTLVLIRGAEELWRSTGLTHTSEIIESIEGAL